MKKFLVLTICFIILTFGANAFALVAYDQTYSYDKNNTLSNGNGSSGATFILANMADNFNFSAATQYPSLGLGSQTLSAFNSDNPTYEFNTEKSGYMNYALSNESVTFPLIRDSGNSTLSSVKRKGTVVPEPASLALVCAGLVALPFARRLKKAIQTQF